MTIVWDHSQLISAALNQIYGIVQHFSRLMYIFRFPIYIYHRSNIRSKNLNFFYSSSTWRSGILKIRSKKIYRSGCIAFKSRLGIKKNLLVEKKKSRIVWKPPNSHIYIIFFSFFLFIYIISTQLCSFLMMFLKKIKIFFGLVRHVNYKLIGCFLFINFANRLVLRCPKKGVVYQPKRTTKDVNRTSLGRVWQNSLSVSQNLFWLITRSIPWRVGPVRPIRPLRHIYWKNIK